MARSTVAMRRWGLPAISALAVITALTAVTADAAPKQVRPAPPPKEATAPRAAGEPLMAIVSIKTQHVTLYDAEGWILRAPVSTGTKGRETPAGIFAVVEKKEDHRSNMYDDAHMPHMQRITWNGIALHGGPLPGYAASHGCVRLPFGFAEKLFGKTRIGHAGDHLAERRRAGRVLAPDLFPPKPEAVAAAPARAETARPRGNRRREGRRRGEESRCRGARETASLTASLRKLKSPRPAPTPSLHPPTRRWPPPRPTRPGHGRGAQAEGRRQGRGRRHAARHRHRRREGQDRRRCRREEHRKPAEAKKAAAAKAASDAKLAMEPVSIYISRATQKLYVRRNTHKPAPDGGGAVFDFDRGADRDPQSGPADRHACVHRGGAQRHAVCAGPPSRSTAATTPRTRSTASPSRRRCSTASRRPPLPRSSIIISDEPLSAETNYRTEFVAVLSNQPQGGFITREPTPKVAVIDPRSDDESAGSPSAAGVNPAGDLNRLPQRGQAGAQRGGNSQPVPQRDWRSQPGNSDWFADPYNRRERQTW